MVDWSSRPLVVRPLGDGRLAPATANPQRYQARAQDCDDGRRCDEREKRTQRRSGAERHEELGGASYALAQSQLTLSPAVAARGRRCSDAHRGRGKSARRIQETIGLRLGLSISHDSIRCPCSFRVERIVQDRLDLRQSLIRHVQLHAAWYHSLEAGAARAFTQSDINPPV